MRLKKYHEFITENYTDSQIKGTQMFLSENPGYNWIVLDITGRPVSGWETLRDGIIEGILTDNMSEDADEYEMNDEVEDFLQQQLAVQSGLDEFMKMMKDKYGYFNDEYDLRLVKRSAVSIWEPEDEENPNLGLI